tara:strand:+ start:476 stop:577 length:102 start_codon:yes stop_codon:yes gene_type:complete
MISDLTFSEQDDFEEDSARQSILLGYEVIKEIK